MHSKSDNIEIMIGKETDEVLKETFESICPKYQIGLEESIKGTKLHQITRPSIDSLEWIKNKKSSKKSLQ